jgi:hypothetical protein
LAVFIRIRKSSRNTLHCKKEILLGAKSAMTTVANPSERDAQQIDAVLLKMSDRWNAHDIEGTDSAQTPGNSSLPPFGVEGWS